MRFLVIGDPLEGLLPATDTGLTIARESLLRGHEVHWAVPSDVVLAGTEPVARTCRLRPFERGARALHGDVDDAGPVADFDVVWVRKDPPVDWRYVSLCWLLTTVETRTLVVNRPSLLVRLHEKMVQFDAVAAGFLREDEVAPAWLLTGPETPLPEQRSPHGWITKPWLGHGGRDVARWDSLEEVAAARDRLLADGSFVVLQPFYPEVTGDTGDRRLFYVDGEYAGDFVRRPARGSIEANLARGGSAHLVNLTRDERKTVDRLGEYLESVGIVLAGADLIAGRITEVNITAPTGLETLQDLTGARLGKRLVEVVEGMVAGKE